MRDHHEGQPEQQGREEWRANLAVCDRGRHDGHDPRERPGDPNDSRIADDHVVPQALDRFRHGGPLSRGRIVGVLDERADGEPDHALIGGVEQHERADREPTDRRGPARQLADQQVERQAEQPDEGQRPRVHDLVGHGGLAQVGVSMVNGYVVYVLRSAYSTVAFTTLMVRLLPVALPRLLFEPLPVALPRLLFEPLPVALPRLLFEPLPVALPRLLFEPLPVALPRLLFEPLPVALRDDSLKPSLPMVMLLEVWGIIVVSTEDVLDSLVIFTKIGLSLLVEFVASVG